MWLACLPSASTGSMLGPRKRGFGRLEVLGPGYFSTSLRLVRVWAFLEDVFSDIMLFAVQWGFG